MRRALAALPLLVVATAALGAATEQPERGELVVHATGFADAGGHAVAKLFVAGDSVLEAGRWQLVESIDAGAVTFRFAGLPAGRYAVVVFHDLNDNLRIDHGLLGPSEPLGFSGGFKLSWVSGRPDFERLRFDFQPPVQTLEVRVR
jgi:uncharacterized protein (DUF2141 family)